MLTSAARQLDESDIEHGASRPRVWRPFPASISGVLCVASPARETGPWMHSRFALTLIQPRSVVRLESRRSVRLDTDAVLLVPALHMFAVRPPERTSTASMTLLVDARDIPHLSNSGSPALVTRSDLIASTADLMVELASAVRPISGASAIVTLVDQLLAESTTVPLARTTTAATPLLPLRDYLRTQLSESVPTATLAERSGLTESHFIRAFHHEFGLPPHAYHMRLRLAHACELLARGESVSTVAYDCGFADQSHLSRKFKNVYNVAPGAWPSVIGDRATRAALTAAVRNAAPRVPDAAAAAPRRELAALKVGIGVTAYRA